MRALHMKVGEEAWMKVLKAASMTGIGGAKNVSFRIVKSNITGMISKGALDELIEHILAFKIQFPRFMNAFAGRVMGSVVS